MATRTPGGPRGRRKQAKPQRKGTWPLDVLLLKPLSVGDVIHHPTKHVELDLNGENRESASNNPAPPMGPDTNHNEVVDIADDSLHKRLNGIIHEEAATPEELSNGLSMHSPQKVLKTGGSADDVPNDLVISVKAAIGEQSEDDDKIREYLQRSDTAVIYPEPVGHHHVSPLTNGITGGKDGDDSSVPADCFVKCPQCQKTCHSYQQMKEHMEAAHPEVAVSLENGPLSNSSAVSPTPISLAGSGGPFGCSQCTTSFSTKDQLDKHELLHSPNAQVSCKICNKTFANVYRLQRHMISHDESAVLRKFKCTECDKAFKFKHHLKEHIRIHSGEKPFECGNCGKRFSHSGSYSSHMTSKKCLVMNLKLGRARASAANALLDKNAQQNRTLKRTSNMSPMNNNITTSPNHNSYLPILPKYSEAAAAFLQSSLANNPSMSPFYLNPGLLNGGHPITPYSIPNLGHIFEQLQQNAAASPLRPPIMDTSDHNPDEYKSQDGLISPKTEEIMKSSSSSCGDLVMDEELEENHHSESMMATSVVKMETREAGTSSGDLEAVKRILETVNATVTKQLLQANMHKFSSEESSDCHSVTSQHSPKRLSIVDCHEHECADQSDLKSEGLAAKLEDAITTKSDELIHNGSTSGNEDHEKINDDDCESVTTTDHVSEDGRKVRVRSLISDEQLKVLKDYYKMNPRPKREDLEKIADTIGFSVRVVQVWFQNTRARDRREGRLIQVPYSPAPTIPLRYPIVPATTSKVPMSISPNYVISEQPLDLSTKRAVGGQTSAESSPTCSPRRPTSVNNYHDQDEVVNLSRKSSQSPTGPYVYGPGHYQNSNSSDNVRQSPSPIDFNNGSRLAQILAQPAHKLSIPGMGLMPMDQLMQLGASDLTQLIHHRLNSMSPNSKKRVWSDGGDMTNDSFPEDDVGGKRPKVAQFVLKGLGSPMLGGQEGEMEGQFSCDQCDKAFAKQSSLARHKYEHSGQRPHKCNECPKAFKHKHHLTEHKRLHSGEKPFQCIKCLKRFSHSGSYSQHMNHRYSYCKPYRE